MFVLECSFVGGVSKPVQLSENNHSMLDLFLKLTLFKMAATSKQTSKTQKWLDGFLEFFSFNC